MPKCEYCRRSFNTAHGVKVHQQRTPACGGKDVRRKTKTVNGVTGKEVIREILAQHPEGLRTNEIFDELTRRGFKLNSNYVTQAAAMDPNLVRVERGMYRLKNGVRSKSVGTQVVESAKTEVMSGLNSMPREALLLRIEVLEAQFKALQDAHLSLIRGAFA